MGLGEWLASVVERDRRDSAALLQVSQAAEWHRELIRSKRRSEAQVDALQRCRFGDNYKPPEDDSDMGHTFINSPIISGEAARELGLAFQNQSSGSPGSPDEPPRRRRRKQSFLMQAAKAVLPLLIATGAGYAVAKYFEPAPAKSNVYDIEAIPYEP